MAVSSSWERVAKGGAMVLAGIAAEQALPTLNGVGQGVGPVSRHTDGPIETPGTIEVPWAVDQFQHEVPEALDLVGCLFDYARASPDPTASSASPTAMVSRALPAISDESEFVSWAERRGGKQIRRRATARQRPHSELTINKPDAIQTEIFSRADEISRSPNSGSILDNRIAAVLQVAIAERAAEIARSSPNSSDFDNWIQAERELKIAARAAEIARSPEAGTDMENWIRAEREL